MSKDSRRDRFFAKHSSSDEVGDAYTAKNGFLPLGITRTPGGALEASRLMPECEEAIEAAKKAGKPVQIAAFDFDGTCIDTSSPRRLVMSLWRRNLISQYVTFRVGVWGIAYKLNLPRNEEAVRERVFSAFKGRSALVINSFLADFYKRKIDSEFRQEADACLAAHIESGHIVVVVSATFEPIIAAAMSTHPIQFALSTRMQIENGDYTGKIEFNPANGEEKVAGLRKFLDEKFADCGWELSFAYGDHFSDIELLEQAINPIAVDPDKKLRKYAEAQGWNIQKW